MLDAQLQAIRDGSLVLQRSPEQAGEILRHNDQHKANRYKGKSQLFWPIALKITIGQCLHLRQLGLP